jgi:hypothetical protein
MEFSVLIQTDAAGNEIIERKAEFLGVKQLMTCYGGGSEDATQQTQKMKLEPGSAAEEDGNSVELCSEDNEGTDDLWDVVEEAVFLT